MRIALFTETFVPKVDGIVTTLCQTVRQLKSLGHEVLIIAPDGGVSEFEQCRIAGVRGRAFPFYPELRLSFPRSWLRHLLQEFRPDVIHAAEPALLGLAALYYSGGRSGGALRAPLVISYHTDLPKYLAYYDLNFLEPCIWPLLRLRHRRATLTLCTSDAMVRELEEHGIARVALWPGGVDAERFRPERRSQAMRARLTDGHPESPLLFYAGRLSPEKGIEGLRSVLRSAPGVRLALAGDGPHRRALEQHFQGFPVHMAGFLHGEELEAAFASSDVFVMPSRTETLGLVVLEAMASGVPVVAARAGGIPEMIDDSVNGFLFDDERQAAEQVKRLIANAEQREAIGRAARTAALDWGWKMATRRLVEHYETARENLHIGPVQVVLPERTGLGFRARQALEAATMFAIRKLLP